MGAVTVSAFRVAGFVVPIHVKNIRAPSVAIHFVDPVPERKVDRRRWSGKPGGRTPFLD